MTRARVVFFAILLAAVGLGLALAIFPPTPSSPNQPPVNTVPSAQSMRKGDVLTFSKANGNAISIADVDAGGSDVKVTLVVTNGILSLSGADATVSGSGTASVTVVGSLANVNAALDNLVFRPAASFNGDAHLTVATSDLDNTGSGGALGDTDTVDVAVNAPVEVQIANATTKQRWFVDLAESFEAAGRKTSKGNPIVITSQPVLSGGSMDDILKGKLKPVVWSPGASSWVQDFDEKWKERGNQALMSGTCRPTIYAPLGIAMWRPMAEALGWPDKPIGWKTIVALAAAPEGWKAFGHPEWGSFRLGYPHAAYSNVGMLFMTAFVYGVADKSAGLKAADVYAPEVEASMRALADKTSKYGTISTKLLSAMADHGPQFLHAVAAFENDTIQFNMEKKDQLWSPLAFIFPSEGIFWTDQPYCIFDQAKWVSPEQADAAKLFLDYLLQPEQQALAMKSYMRPLDSSIPLGEPLDLAHGTDPRIKPDTVQSLPLPNADLMRAVTDVFLITKRKATTLVVLDTSGSMQGEKIRAGNTATADYLKRLHPEDIVGVMTFSDSVQTLSDPKPAAEVAETLSQQVTNLIAAGGTALYQSICTAMDKMNALKAADVAAGRNRMYGIVLLSDGKNTGAGKTENQMFETCLPHDVEAEGVRINAIAFGDDADEVVLKKIAQVTGGEMYKAGPDTIDQIYLNISAEQ